MVLLRRGGSFVAKLEKGITKTIIWSNMDDRGGEAETWGEKVIAIDKTIARLLKFG